MEFTRGEQRLHSWRLLGMARNADTVDSEFFSEALHIHKPTTMDNSYPTDGTISQTEIGILVRQAADSPEKGAKLRDAQ